VVDVVLGVRKEVVGMVAFCARRLIGGVATWLAATFVFYSLLVSPSIPIELQVCTDCPMQPIHVYLQSALFTYMLDKPWPANYFTWLFDPSGTTMKTVTVPGEVTWSGRISASKTLTLARSSLLAGDFGYSWVVDPDTPALAAYGFNPKLLLPTLAASFFLGLLAVLQRHGRLPACRSTRIPANERWRPAEMWAMG
jgi:hypothetical protein